MLKRLTKWQKTEDKLWGRKGRWRQRKTVMGEGWRGVVNSWWTIALYETEHIEQFHRASVTPKKMKVGETSSRVVNSTTSKQTLKFQLGQQSTLRKLLLLLSRNSHQLLFHAWIPLNKDASGTWVLWWHFSFEYAHLCILLLGVISVKFGMEINIILCLVKALSTKWAKKKLIAFLSVRQQEMKDRKRKETRQLTCNFRQKKWIKSKDNSVLQVNPSTLSE